MKYKLPRVCLISLLSLIALCFFNITTYAADGNLPSGVVIGDDKGFQVEHDGNYLFDVTGILPGMEFKRSITIGNYSETDTTPITIEMNMDYDKYKPIIKGKENLLEIIQAKFTMNDKVLYEGPLDFSGLKKKRDKNAPIKIRAFKPGETATLTAEFKVPENVDPTKWVESNSVEFVTVFSAKKDPSTIKEPDESKPPGLAGLLPKTGEELSFLLLGVSIGFLLVILVLRIIMREKKEQRN